MMAAIAKLRATVQHDQIYRNSINLVTSGLVNGILSYAFYVAASHLYTQREVGAGTALIALGSFAATLGVLGFNNSIIRYLPRAVDQSKLMNTALSVVAVASAVSAIILISTVPQFLSELELVWRHPLDPAVFVLFAMTLAMNIIIDNIFTARQATQYTLFRTVFLNVLQLLLIFALHHYLAVGVLGSYAFAFLFTVILGLGILVRNFSYRPRVQFSRGALRATARFSMANYLVSCLNALPALLLPVMVTAVLGAKSNAIYYIAYSLASFLFLIPAGIGNALFAEGSHNEHELRAAIRRTAKITALLVSAGIAAAVVLAPLLLFLFGKDYSSQGVTVLRILALSGVFLAVCYPCGSILNILHDLKALILVNLIGSLSTLTAVLILMKEGFGLTGVAWGWFMGWAVYAATYAYATRRSLERARATTA
jgi:O-antigen/teichoic acid export membrane protein